MKELIDINESTKIKTHLKTKKAHLKTKKTQLMQNVMDRNKKSLTQASFGTACMEHFCLKESLVITKDYSSTENFGDRVIRYVPLYMWLVEVKNE